ncbi:hypothetical protein DL765_008729 [Monosporascus sp. GIB2]|nr:hypothetical protein DL765_008729 [Monosporascus sp. GIB2]
MAGPGVLGGGGLSIPPRPPPSSKNPSVTRMAGNATVSFFTILGTLGASAQQTCKLTPFDADWPSEADWSALNATLGGSLIKT